MTTAAAPHRQPALRTWKDVGRFLSAVLASSAAIVAWTAAVNAPSVGYLRFASAATIAQATAFWGVVVGGVLGPLFLCGVRRWASAGVHAFAVWLSLLVVALGEDWLRTFGLGVLMPLSVALFVRAVGGPGAPFGARCLQLFAGCTGAVVSAPFFRAAAHSTTAAGAFLGTSVGVLLFWAGPLFVDGRDAAEVGRALRIAPARRAADEAVKGWRWLALVACAVLAGGFFAVFGSSVDGDWEPVLFMFGFSLPLVLRSGWSGLLMSVGISLSLFVPSAVDHAMSGSEEDMAMIACLAVIGVAGFAAVAGRVEWRYRVVRIVGFLCGGFVTFLFVVALDGKGESVLYATALFFVWTFVFLADRIPLKSREDDRAAAARLLSGWQSRFTSLVPRSRVEMAAVALFAVAAAVPFVCAGSGFRRTKVCYGGYYQCEPGTCCDVPLPELYVDEVAGRSVAVSEGPISWATQFQATSVVPGGATETVRGALEFLNEVSSIEGLSPCYDVARSAAARRSCTGYRLLLDSDFARAKSLGAVLGPSMRLDARLEAPFRVLRELKPAESAALAASRAGAADGSGR